MKELDKVLDNNEKIFWEGRPVFWPYVFSASSFIAFWGIFIVIFVIFLVYDSVFGTRVFGMNILLTPQFWIAVVIMIGTPIYLMLLYKHTYYAITNKRVIFQKGLIGRDFEMVDFDQITNSEVNVGIWDKLFAKGNSGSILISSAGSFTVGYQNTIQKPYTMRNVPAPYDVFKLLKKVSFDVKTDIEYPNKLRPGENPGYQTDYKNIK